MAFSKELKEVIEAALADGVITEKERAVLHKKALQEGADPDEVDVLIDGRLQQKYNEVEAAKQKVRKCPSCGEIIPAMTAVCPCCGQVIDTSNPENKALQQYMDKLEQTLVKFKKNGFEDLKYSFGRETKASLESLIRQGKTLYEGNAKIIRLISQAEDIIEDYDRKFEKSQSFWRQLDYAILIKHIIYILLIIAIAVVGIIYIPLSWIGCCVYVIGVVFLGFVVYHIIDDKTFFFD